MIRRDLRSFKQTRELSIALGGIDAADGSAKLSLGETSVSAHVSGPAQPKYGRHERSDRCHLEIEILPSSATDTAFVQPADHFMLTEHVRRTLSSSIQLDKFPRNLITIKVLILQNKGSLLAAILNACTLALLDAGIPMNHYITSVQLCKIGENTLFDPTIEEEQTADISLLASFVSDASLDSANWMLAGSEMVGETTIEEYNSLITDAHNFARAFSSTIHESISSKFR